MNGHKCPYRAGRRDGPLQCSWYPGTKETSPHMHEAYKHKPKILNSILEYVGQTPLVRINRITVEEGIQCELLAKCEFFSCGGSVKDRIAKRMIEDAENIGRIKPGDVLIEPTSGNTGIGLALAAAVKGYKAIITLPEKMSGEKVTILKALGAEIIRTPTEAAFDSPDSHIGVAMRLQTEIPHSHILDQYRNPANPLAHYDTTAEELLEQTGSRIDAVVISAGTGGTLTGIGRKLKTRIPEVKIYAADPIGSILAEPDSLNETGRLQAYKVEGIGYDFVPTVLDRALVDEWIKTDDRESLLMARRLIREEGMLCGGSSGSAMVAAIEVAKRLPAGKRVVVILADSSRNYLTKHIDDDWMIESGFTDPHIQPQRYRTWWASKRVADLKLPTPITVCPDVTCKDVITLLSEQGIDTLPVITVEGQVLGVVTEGNLTARLVSNRVRPDDLITKAIYSQFRKVSLNDCLGALARHFERDAFALVVSDHITYSSRTSSPARLEPSKRTIVTGIVTRIDMLNYISKQPSNCEEVAFSPLNM